MAKKKGKREDVFTFPEFNEEEYRTKEIRDSEELSLSLVEEFKKDEDKNEEIAVKIQNYGQNIFIPLSD